MGHTDPDMALSIYAHAMRREAGENDRLRALVDGESFGSFGSGAELKPACEADAERGVTLALRSTAGLAEYTPGRIRTSDFCLRRAALYPLSYGRLEE